MNKSFVNQLNKLSKDDRNIMFEYFGVYDVNDLSEIIINTYMVDYSAYMDFPPEIWAKIAQNPNVSQSDRLNLALTSKRVQAAVGPIIDKVTNEELNKKKGDFLERELVDELLKEEFNNHNVQLLIRSGNTDLNYVWRGFTPLMAAIYKHPTNLKLIGLLLKRGADPNIKNQNGYDALIYLVSGDNKVPLDTLRLLLKYMPSNRDNSVEYNLPDLLGEEIDNYLSEANSEEDDEYDYNTFDKFPLLVYLKRGSERSQLFVPDIRVVQLLLEYDNNQDIIHAATIISRYYEYNDDIMNLLFENVHYN